MYWCTSQWEYIVYEFMLKNTHTQFTYTFTSLYICFIYLYIVARTYFVLKKMYYVTYIHRECAIICAIRKVTSHNLCITGGCLAYIIGPPFPPLVSTSVFPAIASTSKRNKIVLDIV